jgi:purine-binding chemotaxis protein CheW
MDILAARKKAAEKEHARKKQEPEQPAPSPETRDEKHPEAGPPAGASGPAAAPAGEGDDTTAASGGDLSVAEQSPEIELLAFLLRGEEYAVPVADVREVLKMQDLTAVPNAPDYILGVMSLRGTMLPVIDLSQRLDLTPGVRDEKSRIIVVSSGDEDVGLMVDRVRGVFRISADEVKPTPENIEKGAEFLKGIARTDDRLTILLDLGKAVAV